ncbi:MAG: MotA/TolQ/ExbB proton channel family protein [Salinivirgaceae bacterium]|jgi:biopolymer transport protein ExbB/TolQ
MKDLFFMGGPGFMGVLTLLLVITTAWIIYHFIIGYNSKQTNQEKLLRKIDYGKSMGLFAMVTGIFGQLIGFYFAFSAMEQAADISPTMVFGGIKASMITTLYGIIIYLFSFILWFVASTIIEKKLKN